MLTMEEYLKNWAVTRTRKIKSIIHHRRWMSRKFLSTVETGVTCDNKACGYVDRTTDLKFSRVVDYISYLFSYRNRPCPECGQVLITDNHLASSLLLLNLMYSFPIYPILLLQKRFKAGKWAFSAKQDKDGNLTLGLK